MRCTDSLQRAAWTLLLTTARIVLTARAVLTVLTALSVLSVSCGRSTTLAYDSLTLGPGETDHPSEISVAYLRSLTAGESTLIDRPFSVCGRVTATDAYGEYFKSICIEDSTAGIEVLIDGFALYRIFALYDRVRVECHGLTLARYGSTIQLGAPPSGEYAADRIAESVVGRYISVDKAVDTTFEPMAVTIGGLRPEHVGRTVRIEGLRIADEALCWCDTDPLTGRFVDTERRVADGAGAELTVCLRGGCRYASEPLPAGRFALCGIVEYRAGAYALRITNRAIFEE